MPPRKKTEAVEPTDSQPKAKREKKTTKHKVVAIVTPDGIQGAFQPEQRRPLIAHLPIKTSEIQFLDQPITYDPRPPGNPEAFNAGDIDPFSEEATYYTAPETGIESPEGNKPQRETQPAPQNQLVSTTSAPAPVTTPAPSAPSKKEYGPTTLLVQYKPSAVTKELPTTTDVACFWCCEQFSGRPCVLPSYIVEDVWHVYGNYCTPQCALAYLLSEGIDTHTRWERIALLNRLYSDSFEGRIYPAPSRESLQRFGGPISPADFRSMCESQRVRVDIHLPPMVSILASLDTKPIDFYETTLRNSFASPYQQLLAKQQDETPTLKLKRSKPLKDKENTLDAVLQIQVR
jgi:hypothetical protein